MARKKKTGVEEQARKDAGNLTHGSFNDPLKGMVRQEQKRVARTTKEVKKRTARGI